MTTAQKMKPIAKDAAYFDKKPSGLVCDHPMSSVMVVFGIGIGVGMTLGGLLAAPAKSAPTFVRRTEHAAEQLGRQMLDAIASVLPNSLAKHVST